MSLWLIKTFWQVSNCLYIMRVGTQNQPADIIKVAFPYNCTHRAAVDSRKRQSSGKEDVPPLRRSPRKDLTSAFSSTIGPN